MERNQDIEWNIKELKRAYREQRKAQTGREYVLAPRYKNIASWQKAAEYCAEQEIEPELFIKALFKFNRVPGGPFPNSVGGPAHQQCYDKYAEQNNIKAKKSDAAKLLADTINNRVKTVKDILIANEQITLKQIIKDNALDFEAYIRIILANGDPDIISIYAEEAEEELENNPKLKKVLLESKFGVYFKEVQDD